MPICPDVMSLIGNTSLKIDLSPLDDFCHEIQTIIYDK